MVLMLRSGNDRAVANCYLHIADTVGTFVDLLNGIKRPGNRGSKYH